MNLFKLQLVLLAFIFFSCETDDNNQDQQEKNSCNVISVNPITFYYDYIDYFEGFVLNPDFEGITFEYNAQNQIQRVIGGPIITAPGQGLSGIFFTNAILYDIINDENTFTSRRLLDNNNFIESIYVIENNRIISRKVSNIYSSSIDEYTYNYQENIIEEYDGTRLNSVLHLENGNLVKLEKRFYSANQELVGKTDIIFSNYDTTENLLKNLFYVEGNFYKAFSNNNFKRVDENRYSFDGNEFIPISIGENYIEFNLGESENGTSNIFTTDCE